MHRISPNFIVKGLFLLFIGIILVTPARAAPPEYTPEKISPNIALDSYVYGYLDKLSGLNYIPRLLPATKPYTRLQAARWLWDIDQSKLASADTPAYVRSMVRDLEEEFCTELAVLRNGPSRSFSLREVSISAIDYDGDTLDNHQTESTYQPLNINNNGYRYSSGVNGTLRLQLAGNLGSLALASLTPRLELRDGEDADTDLESAYIKTAFGNWELQVGKDPMWWGQGLRGTRALTNNAAPITGVKISTLEPFKTHGILKPLREVGITSFYGRMTEDRTAADVQNPGFFGLRTDIQPNKNLTIGTSLTSIVGGDGRGLSWGDFWNFFTGNNASNPANDKWDSIAGLDFRLRLPKVNGIQLYGELYGEDQAKSIGFFPTPSKTSELVGIYIPRLSSSGDWDATFEWADTSNVWYSHWVYKDGYVNEGNIIGDAMGWNARRYYARFNHYDKKANVYSLSLEHLIQDTSRPFAQKVDSIWLSHHRKLSVDQYINLAVGLAKVKNADYIAGRTEHNHLFSITLVQNY